MLERNKFTRVLILVVMISVLVMVFLGHAINDPLLTSFGEKKVTMKFVTAFLFVLSTLTLVVKRMRTFISIAIIITASYTYSSWLFNKAKPLFLPIFEDGEIIKSLDGDIPSWMTLVAFMIFAIGNLTKQKNYYKMLVLISIVAFVGHLTKVQFMYYFVDGFSTGMAINTAILFSHIAAYKLIDDEQN